jgi:hypothetical protein
VRLPVSPPGRLDLTAELYRSYRTSFDSGISIEAGVVSVLVSVTLVTFSGTAKIRHDPHIVQVIHEVVGVPLKYFPLLAA